MKIQGRRVLVLGGSGLVGMAVCRRLLERTPAELRIHSLRPEESDEARAELLAEAGDTVLSVSSGDILGFEREMTRRDAIGASLRQLEDHHLPDFSLYRLLEGYAPDIVIDCVNTATAIAYRDVYRAAEGLWAQLDELGESDEMAQQVLEALYIPRLIRHIQVLYRGMVAAGTWIYVKVGTSGTGGMGLNVPYTHSEEKPSRTLLSKSAVAGAHSMLLFLMARTPEAPITKEIKPAAAIAWKKIARGPIYRRRQPIRMVDARPKPLGETFSSHDETAGAETDEILETTYIDTGENGIFSLEEFALLTTAEQMEFVTPEEIAANLVFEIEGRNTGHDVINALDNAVMGPTYRAGLMRHWALERMIELERDAGPQAARSVAFEMLGPPRNSKLLFEAHLLREAFGTMTEVRHRSAAEVAAGLDRLVRERPRIGREVISVGIPILLGNGELLRGPRTIVPEGADAEEVTPEKLERWVRDGWVDLREPNCAKWIERFQKIEDGIQGIPEEDTSSRRLRSRRFWNESKEIQPGKLVGWILTEEEKGARIKR